MTVHSPGLVFCRSNDLGMDFCWGWFCQFFRDFGGAQKYTLILHAYCAAQYAYCAYYIYIAANTYTHSAIHKYGIFSGEGNK